MSNASMFGSSPGIVKDSTLQSSHNLFANQIPVLPVSGSTPVKGRIAYDSTSGDIYYANGAVWAPLSGTSSLVLAGDANGPVLSNTVTKINNQPVATGTVTGQILEYNSGTTSWVLNSVTPPSSGNTLIWSGTAWVPSTPSITLGGDVTGASGANTVVRLQGTPVSASVPAPSQVLTNVGGVWTPQTPVVTMTGDVTGLSSANTVVKLQGFPVSAVAPTAGQVLTDVGGVWTPQTPGGGATALSAYGYAVNSSTTVIGANADVVFSLGATPFPNAGFTSVPAPGGTAFVIASTGTYEFDFIVTGTHAAGATTPIQMSLYQNGAVPANAPAFAFSSNLQGGATDVQVCHGHGIIALTAADSITLHNLTNTVTDAVSVTSIGGGVGAARVNCSLKLMRIA